MISLILILLALQQPGDSGTLNCPTSFEATYDTHVITWECHSGTTPTAVTAVPTSVATLTRTTIPTITQTPIPGTGVVVGSSSGEYPTILAGMNAAADGDTVRIRAGTYNVSVALTKSLTLEPYGDGQVWIDGQCTRASAITIGSAGASDSVIKGLGIRNTVSMAIHISGVTTRNINIDSNTIHDFDCKGTGEAYSAGVASWYGGKGHRITNNTIKWRNSGSNDGSDANCIWFKSNSANPSGGGHYIGGNTIVGCRDGIGGEEEGDLHGQFDGTTIIENNKISDCWDDGVQIEGNTTGVIVRFNIIARCAIGIANAPNHGNSRIEGNDITGGRVGYYGNIACFKVGSGGTGTTTYVNNRCVQSGDGWAQTNPGNNQIVASDNFINVSRYVMEFTSTVRTGTTFNRDCLWTSDPDRFIKWGGSQYSFARFQTMGQEAQGQSHSACGR